MLFKDHEPSVVVDYLFLGQTVPNRRSNKTYEEICSVGVSRTFRRLLRIFPLPVRLGGKTFKQYHLEVERSQKDHREESLQLKGIDECNNIDLMLSRFTVESDDIPSKKKVERKKILDRYTVPSIEFLNERKRSIGILDVDGKNISGFWEPNTKHEESFVFMNKVKDNNINLKHDITRNGFQDWARVKFVAQEGNEQNLMLNSWGVYEWHRKHSNKHHLNDIWKMPHFRFHEKEKYTYKIVVGNLFGHRNRWVAIAIFPFEKKEQKTLTVDPIIQEELW